MPMGQREALLVIALVSFAIPIQVIWKTKMGFVLTMMDTFETYFETLIE